MQNQKFMYITLQIPLSLQYTVLDTEIVAFPDVSGWLLKGASLNISYFMLLFHVVWIMYHPGLATQTASDGQYTEYTHLSFTHLWQSTPPYALLTVFFRLHMRDLSIDRAGWIPRNLSLHWPHLGIFFGFFKYWYTNLPPGVRTLLTKKSWTECSSTNPILTQLHCNTM